MSAPSHWKPWTHKAPSWVLRLCIIGIAPFVLLSSMWAGGMREGVNDLRTAWRDLSRATRTAAKETGP